MTEYQGIYERIQKLPFYHPERLIWEEAKEIHRGISSEYVLVSKKDILKLNEAYSDMFEYIEKIRKGEITSIEEAQKEITQKYKKYVEGKIILKKIFEKNIFSLLEEEYTPHIEKIKEELKKEIDDIIENIIKIEYKKEEGIDKDEIRIIEKIYISLCKAGYKDALTQKAFSRGILRLMDKYWNNIIPHDILRAKAIYADLNALKDVNDNLGHKMGDEYIKAMVDALYDVLGEDAIIIKLGGDEAIAFSNIQRDEKEITEKINEKIMKYLESRLTLSTYRTLKEMQGQKSSRGGIIEIGVALGSIDVAQHVGKEGKISERLGKVLDKAEEEMKKYKEEMKNGKSVTRRQQR